MVLLHLEPLREVEVVSSDTWSDGHVMESMAKNESPRLPGTSVGAQFWLLLFVSRPTLSTFWGVHGWVEFGGSVVELLFVCPNSCCASSETEVYCCYNRPY